MEKKSNMSNVDELCVKYVFDELDPSEITIVEQAMIRDQNLLIEVESLKSTWRKLKKMPDITPPQNISEAIIDQAREHSSQQQLFGSRWKNPGLMATAAVVLFSLLITTAYLIPYNSSESDSAASRTAVMGSSGNSGASQIESADEQLAPWVDRKNMIYIGDRDGLEGDEFLSNIDSLRSISIRRTGDPVIIPPAFHDFQLTGTRY